MKKPSPHSPNSRRARAAFGPEEVSNRLPGSLLTANLTSLYFDWEVPELTEPLVLTFIAEIRCEKGRSRIQFRIDLTKFAHRTADLEKLHDILALRHAGLDDRQTLLRSIEWMLTISLEQTGPHLTDSERRLKAQQLIRPALKPPNNFPERALSRTLRNN